PPDRRGKGGRGVGSANGARTLRRRTWRCCLRKRYRSLGAVTAKFYDELHYQVFDGVAYRTVDLGRATDRVLHFPYNGLRVAGDGIAAHVHDHVEMVAGKNMDRLGELLRDVDILLGHGILRLEGEQECRRDSCAGGLHYIGPVSSREAFSHLASAGVTEADEEHAFGHQANFCRNNS